jgi:hypothetical protein
MSLIEAIKAEQLRLRKAKSDSATYLTTLIGEAEAITEMGFDYV